MKVTSLLAAALCAAPAAAQSPRTETCRKGDDARFIEVVAPGNVGAACDVVYIRDGGSNVTVPYNANIDHNFCRARAAELAATLMADGFDCTAAASDAIEAALAGGPVPVSEADASEPLNVQREALEASPADAVAAAPPLANAVSPEILEQPAPVAMAASDPGAATAIAPLGTASATNPAPFGAPIQLGSNGELGEFRAPKPQKASGAGRLVGAQPSIEDIIDVATAPRADAAAIGKASASGIPPRPAAEIIRGVLAANAAAWNEGNLAAYLAGYSQSPDLMMIKDAVVTTGWPEVKKLHEQEVAAFGEMGRLSYDALDVKFASEDVATVVGRYSLARAAASSDGVMTLVMKQADGRWRIVQDTRIAGAQRRK